MPGALARLAAGVLPGGYCERAAAIPPRAIDDQGGLGAVGSRSPGGSLRRDCAGTVHVGGAEDELLRRSPASGTALPERPFVLLGQQSIADPDARAGGTPHRLGIHPRAPDDRLDGGRRPSSGAHGGSRWSALPPGSETSSSPATFHAGRWTSSDATQTSSAVMWAAAATFSTSCCSVPSRGSVPYRIPVRGLYLASAATFPGGGVHGVPGRAAARLALAAARATPWRSTGSPRSPRASEPTPAGPPLGRR